jgi:AcrR family transcriptional regulator
MNNRKNTVITHALTLFVENGITKTSIQDIIKSAGISKGTFYNYFSSKTECIEAILEQARYDASLLRSELMIGKDPNDLHVLVDQIIVLSNINQRLGLDVLFEEILHSGEQELKALVLRHRILEYEWFSLRISEIFGEDVREHAFEAAVLFYGMMQHMSFTSKITNQLSITMEQIASNTLKYLEKIIYLLIHENTAILNKEKLNTFLSLHNKQLVVDLNEVSIKIDALSNQQLSAAQREIVEAVKMEFHANSNRTIVMNALLKAFIDEFKQSEFEQLSKEVASLIWYDVRKKQLIMKKNV